MRLPECSGEKKATFSIDGNTLTISDIPKGAEYNNIMLTIDDVDYQESATRKEDNSVSFELPDLNNGNYPFWVFISSQRYSTYNHWVGRLGCGRCPAYIYVKNGSYYLATDID